MALSDVKTNGSVAPQGKAPETTANTTTLKGKDERHEKLVAQGHQLRAKMSDEEKQLEGSKSDKIAFIGALGDPNKPQTRKQNKKDIPSNLVVGYALKALEDVDVPRADIKSGFKSFMDVGPMSTEHVKAGETFYLNVFETGALISQTVYGGKFSGEGTVVTLGVKYAQNREEPLPVLNMQGKGSVKENMILIADMVGADAKKNIKGTPKIKEEFASKFSVLYEKRVGGKKGSSAGNKAAGETTKDIAMAFQAYIKARQ